MKINHKEEIVRIDAGGVVLEGNLSIPENARGIVLFAHGSGSSRFSSRNRYVAQMLQSVGLGTLLIDLLTPDEEIIDEQTRHLRFNIEMLAERLVGVAKWLKKQSTTEKLNIGIFGASTGGGAALVAAAQIPELIKAVVSRGGRPDLAGKNLPLVQAPTLLIVGGNDGVVITLNQQAYEQLNAPRQLEIVAGASHLFEETGTLQKVGELARDWLVKYLG